jgi:hypothetical protein
MGLASSPITYHAALSPITSFPSPMTHHTVQPFNQPHHNLAISRTADVHFWSILYVRRTMQTKLTLRLDTRLIRRAKAYAGRRGKSVSTVVADYFAALDAPAGSPPELSPKVLSLLGALSGSHLDEADYRRHLERKHR